MLVEGDDFNEPVADAVRSIVDGHIVLSRDLAARNHYPAVDVLKSVSRVMPDVVDASHMKAAKEILELVAVYRDAEDLINIGAYVAGNNHRIDRAIEHIEKINDFLRQGIDEKVSLGESVDMMKQIINRDKE